MPGVVKNSTGKESAQVWADQFQKPLGLSTAFSWTNGNSVWAYGSQGTCRDYARVGQLLLNKGTWRSGSTPVDIVAADFVHQMGTPQTRFPPFTQYANPCYGLLTWLNPDQDPTKYPGQCKVPGRSYVFPGSDPIANTSLWPTGLPKDAYFAGGANGQVSGEWAPSLVMSPRRYIR
jgi:CubicO group peptidase (beta-lactamase class C family)